MKLKSSVFENNTSIPPRYTCDGENINPPLTISEIPKGTISLVLIVDDPDIPNVVKEKMNIHTYDHWILFNIPPDTTEIAENSTAHGVQGINSNGDNTYTGCCPPDKEHRYFFKLYALDTMLDLPEGSTKQEVETAMKEHIIEQTELVGKYNRLANQ